MGEVTTVTKIDGVGTWTETVCTPDHITVVRDFGNGWIQLSGAWSFGSFVSDGSIESKATTKDEE